MNISKLAAILASLAVLTACGNTLPASSPRTSIPAELVGKWRTGSVSSVNFYNPGTGSWSAPSGDGLFYTFTPDGRFTNGYMQQSSLYGCTTFFMIWLEGTLTVNGATLRIYPTSGHKKFISSCASSLNEDRPLRPEEFQRHQGQFTWQIAHDQADLLTPYLVMTQADGSPWSTLRSEH